MGPARLIESIGDIKLPYPPMNQANLVRIPRLFFMTLENEKKINNEIKILNLWHSNFFCTAA